MNLQIYILIPSFFLRYAEQSIALLRDGWRRRRIDTPAGPGKTSTLPIPTYAPLLSAKFKNDV